MQHIIKVLKPACLCNAELLSAAALTTCSLRHASLTHANIRPSTALSMLQEGSCVLVHSAAGGCGLNALAICLAVGAVSVGTVGSPDKVNSNVYLLNHVSY